MKQKNILIVENEAIVALELKITLEEQGYSNTHIAYRGEQALELIKTIKPDLLLTEIILPGKLDGIEIAARIQKRFKIPVIYVTTNSYLKTDPRLISTKPAAVIGKPYLQDELFSAIKKAL